MSNKVKRKVTVEKLSDNIEQTRRLSVFDRLGPGAASINTTQDRHSRKDEVELGRSWKRPTNYRYQSDSSSKEHSRKRNKADKKLEEKPPRQKIKGSSSPKELAPKKRPKQESHFKKSDGENKIKSTVVVTRPSKTPKTPPDSDEKNKRKKAQEEDDEDWPLDADQMEEMMLVRKKKQLQRELELEMKKEQWGNTDPPLKIPSFSGTSSNHTSDSETDSSSSSSNSSGSSSDSDSSSSSNSSSSNTPMRKTKERKKKSSKEPGEIRERKKSKPPPEEKETKFTRRLRTASGSPEMIMPMKKRKESKSEDRRSKHHNKEEAKSKKSKEKIRHVSPIVKTKKAVKEKLELEPSSAEKKDRSRGKQKKRDQSLKATKTKKHSSSGSKSEIKASSGKSLSKTKSSSRSDIKRSKKESSRTQRILSPEEHSSFDRRSPDFSSLSMLKESSRPRGELKESRSYKRKEPEDSHSIDQDIHTHSMKKFRPSSPRKVEEITRVIRRRSPSDPPRSKSLKTESPHHEKSERRKLISPDVGVSKRRDTHPRAHDDSMQPSSSREYKREEPPHRAHSPEIKGALQEDRKERMKSSRGHESSSSSYIRDGRNSPIIIERGPRSPEHSRLEDRKRGEKRSGNHPYRSEPVPREKSNRSLSPGRPTRVGRRSPEHEGRGVDYEEFHHYPPSRYSSPTYLPPPPSNFIDDRGSRYSDYGPTESASFSPNHYSRYSREEERYHDYRPPSRGYKERDSKWARGPPHRDDLHGPNLDFMEAQDPWMRESIREDEWEYRHSPEPHPHHLDDRFRSKRANRSDWGRPAEALHPRERRDYSPGRLVYNKPFETGLVNYRNDSLSSGARTSGKGPRSPPKRDLSPSNRGGNWDTHNRSSDRKPEVRGGGLLNEDRPSRKSDLRRSESLKKVEPLSRDDRGLPREERGPLREERGSLREDRGLPREDRAPLREERGPPREERGPLREERGPPREDRGPLREDRSSRRKQKSVSPPKEKSRPDGSRAASPGAKNLQSGKEKVEIAKSIASESEKQESVSPKKETQIENDPVTVTEGFSDWSEEDTDEELLTKDLPEDEDVKFVEVKEVTGYDEDALSDRDTSYEETKPSRESFKDHKDRSSPTKFGSDDYITTDSVDYDPISDEELEAMIEEPEEENDQTEKKSGIASALEVDWASLMSAPSSKPKNSKQKFSSSSILSSIGFSQKYAGQELTQKIIEHCQKELKKEDNNEEFVLEHPIAAIHASITTIKKEMANMFYNVGPFRQALSSRHDLHIRQLLCKTDKIPSSDAAMDLTSHILPRISELYKISSELLQSKSPIC